MHYFEHYHLFVCMHTGRVVTDISEYFSYNFETNKQWVSKKLFRAQGEYERICDLCVISAICDEGGGLLFIYLYTELGTEKNISHILMVIWDLDFNDCLSVVRDVRRDVPLLILSVIIYIDGYFFYFFFIELIDFLVNYP